MKNCTSCNRGLCINYRALKRSGIVLLERLGLSWKEGEFSVTLGPGRFTSTVVPRPTTGLGSPFYGSLGLVLFALASASARDPFSSVGVGVSCNRACLAETLERRALVPLNVAAHLTFPEPGPSLPELLQSRAKVLRYLLETHDVRLPVGRHPSLGVFAHQALHVPHDPHLALVVVKVSHSAAEAGRLSGDLLWGRASRPRGRHAYEAVSSRRRGVFLFRL
jgi:hypothetical protein